MKKSFSFTKKSIGCLLLSCILSCFWLGAHAQSDYNAVFAKSSKKKGNDFKIEIMGASAVEIDFGQGSKEAQTIDNPEVYTKIQGKWLGDSVKIYATGISSIKIKDTLSYANLSASSQIDSLDMQACSLTKLDISKCTIIRYLNLEENKLTSIDLTKNTKLRYVNLASNNLSTIGLSKGDSLRFLNVSNNNIGTLSLTSARKLQTLLASSNQITSILSLANAALLENLDISDNNLSNLTISKLIALKTLNCSKNKLKTLDVSANTTLQQLNCSNNSLSTIKLADGSNENYTAFNCSNNLFSFSSILPIIKAIPNNILVYAPQREIQVKPAIYQGDTVDLSIFASITLGTETTQTIFGIKNSVSNTNLIKNTDYTCNGGKIILLKDFGKDSLYITLTNALCPQFKDEAVLRSNNFRVRPPFFLREAAVIMSSNKALNSNISIGLTGPDTDTPIQIDFGNGEIVEYEIKKGPNGQTLINGEIKGDSIKIYGSILGIIVSEQELTYLKTLKGAENLFVINCGNNSLETLDLNASTNINVLQCPNNYLHFNSIPPKTESTKNYVYSPQKELKVNPKYYSKDTLDLSYLINGDMVFSFKTTKGKTLEKNTDYVSIDGKFLFLTPQEDSVYGEINSSEFPLLSEDKSLRTQLFIAAGEFVLEPLALAISGNKEIGNDIFMGFTGTEDNTLIQVDFGDGKFVEYTIKKGPNGSTQIPGKIKGDTIKVYGNLMGIIITDQELTYLEAFEGAENLYVINCGNNLLQYLKLDVCKGLTVFQAPQNNLDLSTLPDLTSSMKNINYAPQKPVKITAKIYVDSLLDLSAHYVRKDLDGNDTYTSFALATNAGKTLEEDVDYTNIKGNLRFLKEADSVFITFSNEAFPDFKDAKSLRSTFLQVKQRIIPEDAFAFTSESKNDSISFRITIPQSETNYHLWVDPGNGVFEEYEYLPKTADINIKFELKGKEIKIKANAIDSLFLDSLSITSISFASDKLGIKHLDLKQNTLKALDISKLKQLTSLDCRNNFLNFTSLPQSSALLKNYLYAPQNPIEIRETLNTYEAFDMVSSGYSDGEKIVLKWKNENGEILVSGKDYYQDSTVFRFTSPQENIYAELSSTDFPLFTNDNALKTTSLNILLKQEDRQSLLVEANTDLGLNDLFKITLKTTQKYAICQIDRGDGKIKTIHIEKAETDTEITDTVLGKKIKIFSSQILSLDISKQELTELKIADNNSLKYLNCAFNLLSEINLNTCKNLSSIYLHNNYFALDKLPENKDTYTEYNYAPQAEFILTITENVKTVNLGRFYKLANISQNQQISSYSWHNKSDATKLKTGVDYTEADGVFTFLKPTSDSIYCIIENANFPEFKDNNTYKTSCIKIVGVSKEFNLLNSGISFVCSKSSLYLYNLQSNDFVRIVDINGREKVTEKVFNNSKTYSLEPGIYILQVNSLVTKALVP